jgi:hypothetical protein
LRASARFLVVLATAATAATTAPACGAPPSHPPATVSALEAETEAAYVAEDAAALRTALARGLMRPGYRRALELSRVLQDGDCRRQDLETVLAQNPTWIAYLEHGDCSAQIGRERDALEDFVRAVDLAESPEAVHYIVRRVCRAADQTGLRTLAEMCVGYVP